MKFRGQTTIYDTLHGLQVVNNPGRPPRYLLAPRPSFRGNLWQSQGAELAQNMVDSACGCPDGQGILPGEYCEPSMATIGSQDTIIPMPRYEFKSLTCLEFTADLRSIIPPRIPFPLTSSPTRQFHKCEERIELGPGGRGRTLPADSDDIYQY